tara:strand:+ start:131 stop:1378 length:1248 start_codon:yes stop_codon:yes gene_type:complete
MLDNYSVEDLLKAARLAVDAKKSEDAVRILRLVLIRDPSAANVYSELSRIRRLMGSESDHPVHGWASVCSSFDFLAHSSWARARAARGERARALYSMSVALGQAHDNIDILRDAFHVAHDVNAHHAFVPSPPPMPLLQYDEERVAQDPADTLVLGAATGYGPDKVSVFVQSLRRIYPGRVHFFISPGRGMEDFLGKYDVEFEHVEIPKNINSFLYRFKLFRDKIEQRKDAARILVADTRDVFFQSDPFEYSKPGSLIYFLEHWEVKIGQCSTNRRWFKQQYGQPIYEFIANRPITCGGVVMGDRASLGRYFHQFLIQASLGVPGLGYGADQAIHNFVAHFGLEPTGLFAENGRPVLHVGHVPDQEITVVGKQIKMRDGGFPAIVHQWDRRGVLRDFVRDNYGSELVDWEPIPDNR